jgi:hypothetical protein
MANLLRQMVDEWLDACYPDNAIEDTKKATEAGQAEIRRVIDRTIARA